MTSLYLHIPFCAKKCFYCSFPVAVASKNAVVRYVDCLCAEASSRRPGKVKTVYFGGGTPSLLPNGQIEKIFLSVKKKFNCHDDCEFTIECNPEDITKEKCVLFKEYSVNRVSVGVQTFNSRFLKYLGRVHNTSDVYDACEALRGAGFYNINLDIMHSMPGQTLDQIREDLKSVVAVCPEHVSAYSLAIEKESRFYHKKVSLLSSSRQARNYDYVRQYLEQNGYRQYEVSNFCKKGRESKHNLNYWQGGDYEGLGQGAHSHYRGRRWWNVARLKEYITRIEAGDSPEEGYETLCDRTRLKETLLFGLRMNDGVNLERLQAKYKCRLTKSDMVLINELVSGSLLYYNKKKLRATDKGRLVLDEISKRLI